MTIPLARERSRKRRPALEPLEDRRLLAYAPPGPVMTISESAAAGAAFRALAVGVDRVFVAWEEDAGQAAGSDVYARWYNAGGVPIGDAFPVAAGAGDQAAPRVAAWPDGGVVVSWWTADGIGSRRYAADGSQAAAPALLPGTAGLSRDFELFGVAGGGLSIYAAGFHVRRYGPDGGLTASFTAAPVAAGWAAVESDSLVRAGDIQGETVLTWSEVRPDPGGAGFDSRVVVGFFDATGALTSRNVVEAYEDRDAAFADDLDPQFLWQMSDIAWLGERPQSGRRLLAASVFSHAVGAPDSGIGAPAWGQPAEALPTAVATRLTASYNYDFNYAYYNDTILAHYVQPGRTDGPESYFRSWTHLYSPGIPGLFPGSYYWSASELTATPDLPPEAIGSVQIVTLGGEDLWLVWNGPGGGLHAQRYFSTSPVLSLPDTYATAGEADGSTTIRVTRTGDISQSWTVAYRTVAVDGLAGYDFVPAEGWLTFAAGSAEATLVVPILDDAVADGDKTFRVEFTAPAGTWFQNGHSAVSIEIQDDEPAEWAPLTFFDYGPDGLWSFNEVQGWAKLNDLAPRSMIASPDGTLFLDYGDAGLWSWDALRRWRKLNDVAPEAMTYGAGGRLILDYGASGLWTLHDIEGWARSNTADPVKMVANRQGLLVDFGAAGVWAWTPGSSYTQISLASPEGMAFHGDQIYFDFGPGGLWSCQASFYQPSQTWEQISTADPESIAVPDDSDEVYIDFGAGGFWRWDPYSKYKLLSTWDPSQLELGPRSSYWVPAVVDFPGRGVWRWTESTDFQPISESPLEALSLGSGTDAVLDFGRGGVWRWSPTAGWRKLNDLSPRAIART